MEMNPISIIYSIITLVCITFALKFLNWVWIRPKKLEKYLRSQGFNGNSYRFLLGDTKDYIPIVKAEKSKSIDVSDDIIPHILPYHFQIINKYGKDSFVWFGTSPRLNISDPGRIREILMKPGVFQKPSVPPMAEKITGGLLFLQDEKWAKHRKLINPAFHFEKLKNMTSAMCVSSLGMLEKWETLFSDKNYQDSHEIDVWPYLESLSGDMISRTAFGSSHDKGKTIFELQKEQVKLTLNLYQISFIPGWRYFPTKANKRMKVIISEIKALLRGIINQRENLMRRGEAIGDDLLGLLMQSNFNEMQEHGNKNMGISIEEIIEECKLFYFAGSETTSNLIGWTMVLLSKHQEWQTRARDEVLRVFGKEEPTFDGLSHLKIVTMILYEVLRLYPPAPVLSRAPIKTVKLGSITIPAGVELSMLVGLLHYDPDIWGTDAKEFKPERFSNGISSASKTQFSFLPFSSGPRVCVGQNFAMMEAKIAMAMILQRFSFELSPSYKHGPFSVFTLQPQFGIPLILHKL